MGYKELSDSYLLSMTKKQIIEQLRCAEYNFRATEETLEQQIENTKDWHPVVHAVWERSVFANDFHRCSACNSVWNREFNYCPNCGAKVDGGISRDG